MHRRRGVGVGGIKKREQQRAAYTTVAHRMEATESALSSSEVCALSDVSMRLNGGSGGRGGVAGGCAEPPETTGRAG